MKKILVLLIVAFAAAGLTDARAEEIQTLVQEDLTGSVSFKDTHMFESDVNAQSGQISINESQFNFERKLKFDQLPVTFSYEIRNIDINENIPTPLPTRLVAQSFGVGTKVPMPFVDSDKYFLGVDIFPSMYRDDADWKAGSFRIPFRTYLIYKESDDFYWVAGIMVRPGYDTVVIPILGFHYRANDKLEFNMASSDPHIAYKLNGKTTLRWNFGYAFDEYEVTRDGQNDVVLKYNYLSTGAGLQYDFARDLMGMISVGGVFSRHLRYRDGVGKVEPDSGLYTSAKFSAKF